MNIRVVFSSFLLLTSMAALAQDKLYKKDGSVIDARIKAVNDRTVVYKRHDNPNGPEYTILRKEVKRVEYENGTSETSVAGGRKYKVALNETYDARHKNKFGNNIISVTPGAYTAALDGSINDVGVGATYERLLDDNGHFGIVLPVLLNFSSDKDFNYRGNSSSLYNGKSYTSLQFAPGIKFYPARRNEKVRYAIGGNFFAIFGKEPYLVYDNYYFTPGTGVYYPTDKNYTMYGFMFYNSINVSPSPHFFMELFLSTGIPFSDNRYRDQNVVDNLFPPFMQFGLKIGGRM